MCQKLLTFLYIQSVYLYKNSAYKEAIRRDMYTWASSFINVANMGVLYQKCLTHNGYAHYAIVAIYTWYIIII